MRAARCAAWQVAAKSVPGRSSTNRPSCPTVATMAWVRGSRRLLCTSCMTARGRPLTVASTVAQAASSTLVVLIVHRSRQPGGRDGERDRLHADLDEPGVLRLARRMVEHLQRDLLKHRAPVADGPGRAGQVRLGRAPARPGPSAPRGGRQVLAAQQPSPLRRQQAQRLEVHRQMGEGERQRLRPAVGGHDGAAQRQILLVREDRPAHLAGEPFGRPQRPLLPRLHQLHGQLAAAGHPLHRPVRRVGEGGAQALVPFEQHAQRLQHRGEVAPAVDRAAPRGS